MKHQYDLHTINELSRSTGIRQAFPDDLPFIRSLSIEAFSVYGDYETILTDFFVSKGVYTFVAEEICKDAAIPAGILMMVIRKRKWRRPYFAEIIAIAVERAFQRQGIGSRMIEFAKRWPLCFSGQIFVPEVHLSVAESNAGGHAFFQNHGFEVFQKEPWAYPAGQTALRMRFLVKNTA
jgi:ribosomal protein S18 acetylase RimI-like enzyme